MLPIEEDMVVEEDDSLEECTTHETIVAVKSWKMSKRRKMKRRSARVTRLSTGREVPFDRKNRNTRI